MPVTLSDPDHDRRIRRMLDHYAVDPADTPTFEALEEHLFLSGAWSRLAGVYEARLSVLAAADAQRSEVLLRLAELLAERLRDAPGARRRYEELLRSQPQNRRGLAGLRRLYTGCGELSAALQIGELEEALARTPDDRASLLAETGELWLRLGVNDEARRRLAEAVELDPASDAAARSFAELALREGRGPEAIALCERRLGRLAGSARADAMEQLARLLGPEQLERQRTLLREIVRAFPQRRTALERLIELERGAGEAARVDELQRTLWRSLREAPERAQLALEAGTYQLEDAGNLDAALFWVQQAHAAAPGDARIQELRVRLYRRAGQAEPLIDALEQLASLTPPSSTRMLEIAALHARVGRPERALEWLERLLAERPGDPEALALLDQTLARLGRSTERAAVLERRIASAADPAEAAELLTTLGDVCALEIDDARAAEQAWRQALECAPGQERAAAQLAQLLRKQERTGELAGLLARRARHASGARAAALYAELGRLQLDTLGDPLAARGALLAALDADPRNADALSGLRELAAARGDVALGLEACERELAIDPEPERCAALLAELVELAQRAGDLPRARRTAQRWADLEASPAAWAALADTARATGDAAAERAALTRLEAMLVGDPPQRARALLRLADAELEGSAPDALERAAEHCAAALELAPSAELRARLADLYRRSGQLPELALVLRAQLAVAEAAQTPQLRLELARVQAELGDADGAIAELQPAFAALPTDPEIAGLLEELLGEQDRVSELVDMLGQRLARERDPARRRDLAQHQAALLLDGLQRPADAVAVLRELADPSRDAALERLFGEALAAAGNDAERESWLAMREAHVDGAARIALLLELAGLQERGGRGAAAIASLQRAQRLAGPDQAETVRAASLALLHRHGAPEQQREFLDQVIAQTSEPGPRASFLIERARLWIDALGDPGHALADLDEAQRALPLGPGELSVVAALFGRAGAHTRRARSLELLAASAADAAARRAAALELATLRARGPRELRDPAAAERLLRELLELDPADAESFDRLAELCSAGGREAARIELLRARLSQSELRSGERAELARQLADLLLAEDRTREAVEVLATARRAGAAGPALDECLYAALTAHGDTGARAALCRERALAEPGSGRTRWLRRWLACLEHSRQPAGARLEALELLLVECPGAPELIEQQIALLREHGAASERAQALEAGISATAAGAPRRRAWLRELLDLHEGVLASPERALALLEREVELSPELLGRAARLAAKNGDAQRERRLLESLVAQTSRPDPALLRQLGLARARTGAAREAEPLLWTALERDPRDLAVAEALEALMRASDDRAGLLRALGARFGQVSDAQRPGVAREAWQLAAALGERELGLVWLRRACALGEPDASDLRAWLELETALGDRLHALGVIELLLAAVEAPGERAELLAQQAEILEARGQLEAAIASWREALALDPRAPIAWLRALERLCARLGRSAERAGWLARLAEREELPAAERERFRSAQVELLAADPRLRAEAALLLARVVESGGSLSDPPQRARAQQLLELYDRLGRDADWCALALRLAPELEPAARPALLRERARRLSERLGAGEHAIAAWEAVLRTEPDDREALDALLALRNRPGDEAQRAGLLQRRAALGGTATERLWLEAAQLSWQALGDADAALAAAERALALAPGLAAAHALRWQLCGDLDQPEAEAESLRIVLAAQPDDPARSDLWLRLAQLAAARPGGEPEAVQAARRALESPLEPAIRREIRRVLERCGAWREAAELLRAELDESPEASPEALRQLARIEWDELRQASPANQALERLAACTELELEDRERWAAVRDALGDRAGAIEQRRRALELARESAGAERWLLLARDLLDGLGDAAGALEACSRAISAEPRSLEALELRARIHRRLGRPAAELDDCTMLAELLPEGAPRADAYARAGELAAGALSDDARAWLLFRSALRACSSCLPALLGAGRIAASRSEWSEAERMFGLACQLLPGSDQASRLPEVARHAARAAEARGRLAEACHYLELALDSGAPDPDALDALASLSLRLGAHGRALQCLEVRLTTAELAPEARAERLVKLAQAAEGTGALARAAEALEQAVALRPEDEVWRARAVDLLERLGETERAIAQLEAWSRLAPAEDGPRLSMRAAQLELRAGRREAARQRLSALVATPAAPAQAWASLAELELEDRGLEAALRIADAGLERVSGGAERAALLWIRSRALADLGERREGVRCAAEALRFDPTNVEAARVVAAQLGQVGNYESAVRQLERVLDATEPAPAVRAELWEAIGRAHAGPLENLDRAQHCYRRALEANPLRAGAREALADVTAFDPGHHRESLALHRELLEAFPARPGSWRSLARIAEHWRRAESSRTCAIVLEALGADMEPRAEAASGIALVDTDDPRSPVLCAASEILRAYEEAAGLPSASAERAYAQAPEVLRRELLAVAGEAWNLSDQDLGALWLLPLGKGERAGEELPRRPRRRLRAALEGVSPERLRQLSVGEWRGEIAAQAAARVIRAGALNLDAALRALIQGWPATSGLRLRSDQELGAAVQLCPPVRSLLLRVADAAIAQLGL